MWPTLLSAGQTSLMVDRRVMDRAMSFRKKEQNVMPRQFRCVRGSSCCEAKMAGAYHSVPVAMLGASVAGSRTKGPCSWAGGCGVAQEPTWNVLSGLTLGGGSALVVLRTSSLFRLLLQCSNHRGRQAAVRLRRIYGGRHPTRASLKDGTPWPLSIGDEEASRCQGFRVFFRGCGGGRSRC